MPINFQPKKLLERRRKWLFILKLEEEAQEIIREHNESFNKTIELTVKILDRGYRDIIIDWTLNYKS